MKVKYVIDGKDYVTLPAYEMLEDKYNQLEEENKKLNKHLGEKIDTIQVLIREKYEEKGEKLELFKENKKLKEENENLKAIIEHYKKFEEGKNKLEGMLMEEDTLQELRDIGEL